MASTLMVTTSELRKRADELESLNEAFLGKVNGLKDDETLLGQSYVGEAQKQFHAQFMNDAEKFQQFYNVIRQFVQQLRTDAETYDRAEAANVSVVASRR